MQKKEYQTLQRFDKSDLWLLHDDYFLNTGLKAWSSGEVPYTGISNYFEAFKKAKFVVENLKGRELEEIKILEVGAGNGEFAKNFIKAFQEICIEEHLNYKSKIKYYLSDYSSKTIEEIKNKMRNYSENAFLEFLILDVRESINLKEKFDVIFANYLLDQLPARIFVKEITNKQIKYYEKYIALESNINKLLQQKKKKNLIKKIDKRSDFVLIDFEKEINLEHRSLLESCFRAGKTSTVVYSYGALKAIKKFLTLLKPTGLLLCSDFNATSKPGFDKYDPCYYGNSLAQAVNFEFIYKYFFNPIDKSLPHQKENLNEYQMILIYEDPVKPLHTLILTRPDYPYSLKLNEIYKKVFMQNIFLRFLFRFFIELQYCFYLFILIGALMGILKLVQYI